MDTASIYKYCDEQNNEVIIDLLAAFPNISEELSKLNKSNRAQQKQIGRNNSNKNSYSSGAVIRALYSRRCVQTYICFGLFHGIYFFNNKLNKNSCGDLS